MHCLSECMIHWTGSEARSAEFVNTIWPDSFVRNMLRIASCSVLLLGREVGERYCTILSQLTNLSDPDIFRDINIHFDISKDVELEGRTQAGFFKTFLQTLKREEAF